MKEFIYHALGICGEHTHPHLLNISLILLVSYVVYKNHQKKLECHLLKENQETLKEDQRVRQTK